MTNEEFQRIVLEKLGGLEEGQKLLEGRQRTLEEEQKKLVIKVDSMEKILTATYEQIVNLTEFKEEINNKIDRSIEENKLLKEMFGRHEIKIKALQRKIG